MRWEGRRESDNVEDRRSLGGGAPRLMIGGGVGSIVIVVIILLLGGDPRALLQLSSQGGGTLAPGGSTTSVDPQEDKLAHFVSVVLADTEDVWNEVFRRSGKQYREPHLVLFRTQTESGCGFASAASGPFYCPSDEKLYVDLSFYEELRERFGAPGDFAQAYVIAHEVGHHVQHLLGITDRIDAQRARLSKPEYNKLSVRLELQADFLAGVWANHAQKMRQMLEEGDVEEALRAAASIGDDRIQMQSRGYTVPESFTHGSAAQRVAWFRRGLETGDLSQGDTFSLPDPRY
ncbi:MAG: neutral zinc metallopeptidase [Phycisphaerae bacterium]